MKLPCGYYTHTAYPTAPTIPYLPGDEPEQAPPQPGAQSDRELVAIARFPSGPVRGVLWEATIERQAVRARHLGPNTITVSAPATPETMRIIGDAIAGATDQAGRPVYDIKQAITFELLVGSTSDGLVRRRFICRDQVEVSDGRVTINAAGIVGGLTSDRIIGSPTRRNLLGTNSSFEHGDFREWTLVSGSSRATGAIGVTTLTAGSATAGLVAGGPDGGSWSAWVQGTPGLAWLESRAPYSQPERPWGRQRIASTAYAKLPTGEDIDDYGLVTTAVLVGSTEVWPDRRKGDPEAGVVTSEMTRGSWITEPVVGIGYLPTPPFTCQVATRLHAVSDTARTYFDGAEIIRRENTSTEDPWDLTRHPTKLFHHAQRGRDKSTWNVGVVEGTPVGISEVGTWWHPDGQSMDDALEALCGRGMDIWDLAGPGRRVKASKRRGRVRTDVAIQRWNVLGTVTWRVDPGAQRTAIRGVSAAGSIWGGADEGAIDTSQSGGQVIDVVMSGPVGMTPTQLRAWVVDQLAGVSRLPGTVTLLLPYSLGLKLSVGDSVQVALQSGSAGHVDWMRITEWVPERGRRFIAVSAGTDPDLGGG